MKTNLKNKVILLTGASGGIGAGVARAFAAEGARLILHYRRGRAAAEELQRSLPRAKTIILGADLTKEKEVTALFVAAQDAFGGIDTLVANAGIWVDRETPLHEMTLAQWRRTLETDLTAAFLCCRAFFRLVKEQKHGNATLVASTAGVFGEAGHADYAAAKSALAFGFLRTLKNEIARLAPPARGYCGGRVNCVSPGWTVTPLTEGHLRDTALVRRVTATMALPKIARVEDIANLIVFLSSDTLAGHITGQNHVVAGGMEGRLLWPTA